METLRYNKAKLPIVIIILSFFVSLISLWTVINGFWIGLLFIIPVLALVSVKEGVVIDVEKRQYLAYLKVFGIGHLKWKPIPSNSVVGIRVLKLRANRAVGQLDNEFQYSYETLELYIYTPKPERIVLCMSDNFVDLKWEADNIKEKLGLELVIDKRIQHLIG